MKTFDIDDLQATIARADAELTKLKAEYNDLTGRAQAIKASIDSTEQWVKVTQGVINMNRDKQNISALSGTKVMG